MARYVIVGASLAGATAAITLRDEGAEGTVTLIGAENAPPYERHAAVGLNRAKDVRRIMPLIRSRRPVDLEQLRDESVDLRSLEARP